MEEGEKVVEGARWVAVMVAVTVVVVLVAMTVAGLGAVGLMEVVAAAQVEGVAITGGNRAGILEEKKAVQMAKVG